MGKKEETLAMLADMGFPKDKSELAWEKTEDLTNAVDWLDKNADKSYEELTASKIDDPAFEMGPMQAGEVAKSMVCEDCGKKFRSIKAATAHGELTGHENFAESSEELAPLSPEEAKAKIAELKAKAAERKAKQALIDKEEAKRNEQIRMKSTKEVQDAKEKLAAQEQIKEAAKKRQEKLNDIAAKKRIQEKIAADKEARRLKAEQQKAEREGRAPPQDPSLAAAQSAAASSTPSAPRPAATEARLRLQTAGGVLTKTFPAETTLFEVAQAVESEAGTPITSFTMTYPKKTFSGNIDFGKTLKEAGLLPSAVLIVK